MFLGASVAAIALALLAGDLGRATASKDPSPPAGSAAQDLLLRLHDLPPGYLLFGPSLIEFPLSGIDCESLEPAEPRPRLATFLAQYSPAGCLALYQRLFRVPGAGPAPLAVGTGALDAGSVEGAEAGLAVSRELLSHLLGDELPREVRPPATVGDASRLYRWDQGDLFEPDEGSSTFMVWRSGSVVAAIFVAGGRAGANGTIAVELARRQQQRIETRTPYTPIEQDDTEVALDDPALEVPVHWLGRDFVAGHGLPPLRLLRTSSTTVRALNAPRASMSYIDNRNLDGDAITLDIWSREQWRHLRAKRGRLPASLRCATTRKPQIPNGRAMMYAGFERIPGACPNQGPRAYTARIYLPRVVVTVETFRICAICAEAGKGPYNSFRGMATIARGLEPRLSR